MANFKYTIGKTSSIVILVNGTRYDFSQITGFKAVQEVKRQRVDPLNSDPVEFNVPSGWRYTLNLDRGNQILDDLIVDLEAAFWNAGQIAQGTLYQYVLEADGSTSTYEFTGATFEQTDPGMYQSESTVKQTLTGFASRKNRL